MKHTCLDTLVVLAELAIIPGKLDEFLDYTVRNLNLSRSYPGNMAFDILFDDADPNRIRFFEIWESASAQQAYMAWRVQRGDLTELTAFLADAPKFTMLRRVADANRAS
jgi:quinol monooxygenase YgiN